jgi:hypothetical protein
MNILIPLLEEFSVVLDNVCIQWRFVILALMQRALGVDKPAFVTFVIDKSCCVWRIAGSGP